MNTLQLMEEATHLFIFTTGKFSSIFKGFISTHVLKNNKNIISLLEIILLKDDFTLIIRNTY
jgi:hypothetical protein